MSPELWLDEWKRLVAGLESGIDERELVERLVAGVPESLTPKQIISAIAIVKELDRYNMGEALLAELSARAQYIPSAIAAATMVDSETAGVLRSVLRYHDRFHSHELREALSWAEADCALAVIRLLDRH